MAGHTSEKRWRSNQNEVEGGAGVSDLAQSLCREMVQVLNNVNAGFLELQEIYQFNGSTVQGLADQLFYEDWSRRLVDPQVPDVYETQANIFEVAKAQDLFDAITALNEIYSCADNVVVGQEDRFAQIRRMT